MKKMDERNIAGIAKSDDSIVFTLSCLKTRNYPCDGSSSYDNKNFAKCNVAEISYWHTLENLK